MTNPFRWKCLHDPGSWVEKWVTPLSFRHVLSLFNHSRLAHLFFWIEAQRENSKQRWPDYSRTIWGTWKKLSWRISCICSLHPKGTFSRSPDHYPIVQINDRQTEIIGNWCGCGDAWNISKNWPFASQRTLYNESLSNKKPPMCHFKSWVYKNHEKSSHSRTNSVSDRG